MCITQSGQVVFKSEKFMWCLVAIMDFGSTQSLRKCAFICHEDFKYVSQNWFSQTVLKTRNVMMPGSHLEFMIDTILSKYNFICHENSKYMTHSWFSQPVYKTKKSRDAWWPSLIQQTEPLHQLHCCHLLAFNCFLHITYIALRFILFSLCLFKSFKSLWEIYSTFLSKSKLYTLS